ncbi:MAG: RNA polymerase sigma-70 factor [Saprospiraceae bacterium]|nr:RNA polymerase sigma-70 factor [Lewinellaceae bacterium]MBP6811191.1 RNA polymerase sigma-70 factor [Saprospiraceae bacterium]
METPEQQLLSALRFGNEGALRQIFDRHYPLLLSDIFRLIPDESTCQDLAQELFVDLWNKRESLDIHTSLRAYLRRAAVNKSLNYIKANRRNLFEDADDLGHLPDTSASDTKKREAQETLEDALHVAISALPEKCRVVFNLSRFEQLSHREIAEKLGISVKTIENQITKAMKMLREALTNHTELSSVVILWLKCLWGA